MMVTAVACSGSHASRNDVTDLIARSMGLSRSCVSDALAQTPQSELDDIRAALTQSQGSVHEMPSLLEASHCPVSSASATEAGSSTQT
jgi:hypothetical protein